MENTLNIENKKYVSTYVKNAIALFKKNWKKLVLAIIIFYAVVWVSQMIFVGILGDLGQLPYQLFVIFMSIGITRLFLDTADTKKTSVKQIFTGGTGRQFLMMVGVTLFFMAVGIGLGLLMSVIGISALLVPGTIGFVIALLVLLMVAVVVAIGISMYLFAIIDRDKGVFSSLSYSWQITKGYRFKMFVLGFVSILIVALGVLALGVGALIAIPLVSLMQAQLYRELAGPRVDVSDNTEIEITEVVAEEKTDEIVPEDIIEA